MEMIKRDSYLSSIIPFIDQDLIKVLIGIRRSGKTILLSQIKEIIVANGVSEENIIEINFESRKYAKLKDPDELYHFISEKTENVTGKVYLFLDEIQRVKEWHSVIPSFRVDFDCDIYVTGSNSKLLSGDLATHMAGRYVAFHIYPFTLAEIQSFCDINQIPYTKESLFTDYLKYGGMPMRLMLPDEHSIKTYLNDLYESIVINDIVNKNSSEIRNDDLLRRILVFLLDNIGNPFSARSICRAINADGRSTSIETVITYVDKLLSGQIISKCGRYDIKGKNLLTTTEKYYAGDIGLRNETRSSEQVDANKLYENIVYLEMLSRGYDVKVGKLDDLEIDFVCYRGKEKLYIQVAYAITPDCVEREFGNLEKIADNYPKYVVSGDLVDLSRNGIIHQNIIDFLLIK